MSLDNMWTREEALGFHLRHRHALEVDGFNEPMLTALHADDHALSNVTHDHADHRLNPRVARLTGDST